MNLNSIETSFNTPLSCLRDAGDPVENAKFYEKEGADELAILDISATIEGMKTRQKWVKDVLSVMSIPLTVGGGISTLSDMAELLDTSKMLCNHICKQKVKTKPEKNEQIFRL